MKIQPTLIAATVFALAAGFIIGKQSSPAPAPAASNTTTVQPRTQRASTQSNEPAGSQVRSQRSRAGAQPASATPAASAPEQVPAIIGNQDPLQRTSAWIAYVQSLSADEFPDAVAAFRAIGITEQRMSEYEMLMSAWAKTDPLAGLNFITEATSAPFAPQTILATWSATDPDAALGWAEQNHRSDNPNPYLLGVIRGIADHDLTRAAEIAATIPQSRERYQAVEALMPSLFKDGPEAAKHWAESLTDPQFKAGAIQLMARKLAQTDPEGTASWLAQQNLEPRKERRLR